VLNAINYAGPLSVEWEDAMMDREFGARKPASSSRRWISRSPIACLTRHSTSSSPRGVANDQSQPGERSVLLSPCCSWAPRHPLSLVALAIVLALSVPFPAAAVRRPEFRLLKPTELPAIGLKINVMPQVREAPLPPPSVFTYTFTGRRTSWKSDMYAPYELWLQSQLANRWVDEHSNAAHHRHHHHASPEGLLNGTRLQRGLREEGRRISETTTCLDP